MLRSRKSPTSYDKRMLDAADRLFAEFYALPVRSVIDAIQQARQALRDGGELPPLPESVEEQAHAALRQCLQRVDSLSSRSGTGGL